MNSLPVAEPQAKSGAEQSAYVCQKLLRPERFCQARDRHFETRTSRRQIAPGPGDDQRAIRQSPAPQNTNQLQPADSGHIDIGHHEIDPISLGNLKRLGTILRLQRGISASTDHGGHELPHRLVVIHNQHTLVIRHSAHCAILHMNGQSRQTSRLFDRLNQEIQAAEQENRKDGNYQSFGDSFPPRDCVGIVLLHSFFKIFKHKNLLHLPMTTQNSLTLWP